MNFLNSHKLQLAKFLIVGIIAACIYLFSFHLFFGIAQLDYKLAASISYIITITSHFYLHRTFTFAAADNAMAHEFWKYLFMVLINYVTTLAVMWVFVDILKGSPYIGVFISTAFTSLFNFFMMKYFVFQLKGSAPLTI